jgi:GMP synthase-like glutamine amidotransferase
MPTCLVVQHAGPEGPYAIGTALAGVGAVAKVCQVYAGGLLPPTLHGYDGLVVMGGPMSAASDDGFATRGAEVALIEEALEREVPTLGVCLGSQLLAAAAGGKVDPGAAGPEIGWGPVRLTGEAATDLLFGGLPTEMTVLHWHGDTFDLPPGAVHLAGNTEYANQAFRAGPAAWGLQFHLELDLAAVTMFATAFGSEAAACGVAPSQITSAAPSSLDRLAPARDRLLARFAGLVGARTA